MLNIERDSNHDPNKGRYYETPHMVRAMCTQDELSLWNVVAQVCGSNDDGMCFLGTENLGYLCQMSRSSVISARKGLLAKELVVGQKQRHQSSPYSMTWYLNIPWAQLWERNKTWRAANPKLLGTNGRIAKAKARWEEKQRERVGRRKKKK